MKKKHVLQAIEALECALAAVGNTPYPTYEFKRQRQEEIQEALNAMRAHIKEGR